MIVVVVAVKEFGWEIAEVKAEREGTKQSTKRWKKVLRQDLVHERSIIVS